MSNSCQLRRSEDWSWAANEERYLQKLRALTHSLAPLLHHNISTFSVHTNNRNNLIDTWFPLSTPSIETRTYLDSILPPFVQRSHHNQSVIFHNTTSRPRVNNTPQSLPGKGFIHSELTKKRDA